MPDSIPTRSPTGAPSGALTGALTSQARNASAIAPSALPPAGAAAAGSKCGCDSGSASGGSRLSAPPMAGGGALNAPSLRPGTAGAAGAVTATWQSNVHVVGLWSINQDRNCWAYLDNVGWRNLNNASESGLVAMNMLASHAYQLGSSSSLYEEDDGRISQLYVW